MPQAVLQCIKDTYAVQIKPNDNYGELPYVYFGLSIYGMGTSKGNLDAYLHFDLSLLPSLININSAKLRIFVYGMIGTTGNYVMTEKVSVVTQDWNEGTLTYNNAPATNQFVSGNVSVNNPTNWVEFDVKDIITNYRNYNYGLKLSALTVYEYGNTNGASPQFYSSEYTDAALRPQLVIDYTILPPGAPTNLNPSAGNSIDRSVINRFSWQHNPSIVGEQQLKFDLDWRVQGTTTWNTVTQSTVNQYYDFPANTFSEGYIEWEVRTYDQTGQPGAYSQLGVFFAGDKPAIPVITSPLDNAILTGPKPTIQWTATEQTDFDLKVLSSTDELLWEKNIPSTDKSYKIDYYLENNSTYKIQLAVKNEGLWSDFVVITVTTSFVQPPVPTFVVTTNTTRGSATLEITNPVPTGDQPILLENYVYRRKKGELDWLRVLNVGENGAYTDYTLKHNTEYEFKVSAVGVNDSTSDSITQIVTVTVSNSQLALVSDYSIFVELKASPQKNRRTGRKADLMVFAGRKHSVTNFMEQKDNSISMSFKIMDAETLELFENIVDMGETLLFRDSRGRRIFCTIPDAPSIDDELPDFYTINFTIVEIDYIEGV